MNAKELKDRRTRLNLSQFELAKLSGLSRFNISLCENGYRDLKEEEVKSIKTALGKASKCKL